MSKYVEYSLEITFAPFNKYKPIKCGVTYGEDVSQYLQDAENEVRMKTRKLLNQHIIDTMNELVDIKNEHITIEEWAKEIMKTSNKAQNKGDTQ